MEPVRVVIVKAEALVRDALELAIGGQADLAVLGAFAEARPAVDAARHLRPDLVLLDVQMRGMSAFDAARQLRALDPAVRLVLLGSEVKDFWIQEALEISAEAFLTYDEPLVRILQTIRRAPAGAEPHSFACSRAVRERLAPPRKNVPDPPEDPASTPATRISRREREVLEHLAVGLSRDAIAATLCISRKTVDRHIENLMRKTRFHDRLALARFAYREGFARP
jgi:DNA-binding NarL/FixJ family response regulator